MREGSWKRFIKDCEKFDHVVFKDGRAIGYSKDEPPNFGTAVLIPFEYVKITW